MKNMVNRLGRNQWIVLIELFTLVSIGIYAKAVTDSGALQTMILPWAAIGIFSAYNIWSSSFNKAVIFRSARHGFEANPPLRPHWKRWFLVIYTPYLVYSVWFGIFTLTHGISLGPLFTVVMCVLLCCAYLRLCTPEEPTCDGES